MKSIPKSFGFNSFSLIYLPRFRGRRSFFELKPRFLFLVIRPIFSILSTVMFVFIFVIRSGSWPPTSMIPFPPVPVFASISFFSPMTSFRMLTVASTRTRSWRMGWFRITTFPMSSMLSFLVTRTLSFTLSIFIFVSFSSSTRIIWTVFVIFFIALLIRRTKLF